MVEHQLADALAKMRDDDMYDGYGTVVWDALSPAQRAVLKQLLFQGPVWDGNVVCKSARDVLIHYGLASRCCFLGEPGYAVATYLALAVFEQGHGEPLAKKRGSPE